MLNPLLSQGGGPPVGNDMSGIDMYVAEGTLPDLASPLLDKLTKLVDTIIPRLESLERAVCSIKSTQPVGPARADSFNTLLVRIEEIAVNLTRLDKKVETMSTPLPNMMAQPTARPGNLPQQPVPLYSEKVTGVVICKQFDQPKPFEGQTAAQITQKINGELVFAKAVINNEPIRVRVVAQFPNGDVKIYTKDR
ncbi:hypothetical protein PCASD_00551 [Puccinia coronata f. sp. avenae]|uniref:Uncharacterized protein n=1 Tax=Puccinia coronata f. sp. avenae TaxID=200324 RepID=A0A2N5SC56_9BASI|nr:hypothetical protein PCASD_21305 [Puccinia coronata f. sp. avenae]PLW51645.1 hypothetical protein PCASD_00551 [Puccinia coronata f. sp. avenae]